MKQAGLPILFFILAAFGPASTFAEETTSLVVADFDNAQMTNNLGQPIEVWLREDGSDKTQSCVMSFVEDDALGKQGGHSVRLDYDVESENPAYNGIRTGLNLPNPASYKTLNFYIKGDKAKGFTKKLKIELIGQGKPPSPYIVEGITDQWQKITVPLSEFWVTQSSVPLEKFVVVFADINSDPKVCTVYLDQVYFSKGERG